MGFQDQKITPINAVLRAKGVVDKRYLNLMFLSTLIRWYYLDTAKYFCKILLNKLIVKNAHRQMCM